MKIAILSPQDSDQAETFIKNHITHLPFENIVIYGGNFPYLTTSDQPSVWQRRYFKVVSTIKRIFGRGTETFKAYHLRKVLKKHHIDLVFAEYLITGAEVLPVCKSLNIPIVAIGLGYEISQYNIIKQYSKKYKALFQYAKHILVVSNHMKTNLLALDCPDDKIVYSPASPSEDFFELEPHFSNRYGLAVGRFVDKKAPQLTIKAFSEVLKLIPDVKLIMAGDGPLLEECKRLVSDLNIADSIIFKGRITREQHKELLEDSFMFVQHSRIAENGDSEGTPVAILEASAAGLPVVSTHHAGIPNVVKNDETGFLVAENDVKAMAEKMIALFQNKELAMQFGAEGKAYVKENFTLKNHIETISNCILS
ncbi:glycosyltransferase [uncultured Psychroserpens sp.]|uniref:glycosyltransferase n=1 Tax=uncultured Psychroserpens sp. TaxID=255436 RepID=UPI00262507E7|nr:glycosyltransferase [uncultured Psychroserpens sp.]